jgi:hypothetical protein
MKRPVAALSGHRAVRRNGGRFISIVTVTASETVKPTTHYRIGPCAWHFTNG